MKGLCDVGACSDRIVCDSLESWLSHRSESIGASESPVLFGHGYSGDSPYSLWARKVTREIQQDSSEFLEWGRMIQPVAIAMFQKKKGLQVTDLGDYTILRHKDTPFVSATLDGITEDDEGLAIVECKNIAGYNSRDWDGDEPPVRVNIQMQQQMYVSGATHGYAVACIGGNQLEVKPVKRNDYFIDVMLKVLAQFWKCVETNTPPDVDGSPATATALARLHPNDNGETVMLPPDALVWSEELEKIKSDIKRLEAEKMERENLLKAAIGDSTYGLLDDGRRWAWKTQTRASYVVKESSFRVLRLTR